MSCKTLFLLEGFAQAAVVVLCSSALQVVYTLQQGEENAQ